MKNRIFLSISLLMASSIAYASNSFQAERQLASVCTAEKFERLNIITSEQRAFETLLRQFEDEMPYAADNEFNNYDPYDQVAPKATIPTKEDRKIDELAARAKLEHYRALLSEENRTSPVEPAHTTSTQIATQEDIELQKALLQIAQLEKQEHETQALEQAHAAEQARILRNRIRRYVLPAVAVTTAIVVLFKLRKK